ncbi:TSUP family transporter [SAR92 clade bacterium H455]|uniref:Probable membrane transporter protein n=1 Tax=SAR92 clade bacterium H455 TaxID=2974818 RepID=A0ABY5TQ25_9GAMM|nr:TSUP family transporter [SAR92 clade bacterium H455]
MDSDFQWYQYALIVIVFIWSGFVRAGFGFGGALFTIPFLLLIHNDPLFFLPIISLHLLFFAALTLLLSNRAAASGEQPEVLQATINWPFVRYALLIMLIPKLAGVLGLLILPSNLMNSIIFLLISAYAITYIIGRPLQSNSRLLDTVFLILGAYISGTSLIGGPLVIAVAMRHIQAHEFRNTLFVLWFVLVSIKLFAFALAGVDLQLMASLWLLPFAGIGHLVGQKFHHRLLQASNARFYQILGWVLLSTSLVGLLQILV